MCADFEGGAGAVEGLAEGADGVGCGGDEAGGDIRHGVGGLGVGVGLCFV